MDSVLATKLFEQELAKLKKVMSDDLINSDIFIEKIIYVNLPRKNDGIKFLLKITCDEEFPLEPADYMFVNPVSKKDDDKQYWPTDNNQAFKLDENPRWICLAGTKEYKKRHPDHQFNSKIHTLSQTVFHILRQINGWLAKK